MGKQPQHSLKLSICLCPQYGAQAVGNLELLAPQLPMSHTMEQHLQVWSGVASCCFHGSPRNFKEVGMQLGLPGKGQDTVIREMLPDAQSIALPRIRLWKSVGGTMSRT